LDILHSKFHLRFVNSPTDDSVWAETQDPWIWPLNRIKALNVSIMLRWHDMTYSSICVYRVSSVFR
jgi:hypothetical protein